MEMKLLNDRKLVEIWLTHADEKDEAVQAQVKQICQAYHQQKYRVAVFHSGDRDLYQSTLDLLIHNRKVMAEQEVQRMKKLQKEAVPEL